MAPYPVCMPDGTIFVTARYGARSKLIKVIENNGKFTFDILNNYSPREGLACEQQTPILWNNHLFSISPKDGETLRNQLVCVHSSNPQEIVWFGGPGKRFGLGYYILAYNKLYLFNNDGTLYIIQPSATGYIELVQARIIADGKVAWVPIAWTKPKCFSA